MNLPNMDSLKEEWEKELGTLVPAGVWEDSLEYIHKCSNT